MAYTPPVHPARELQLQAWSYYGNPAASMSSSGLSSVRTGPRQEAVGEVRYIVGWAADQMSRMKWKVLVDGEAEWEIDVDGATIRSRTEADAAETPESNEAASATLLKTIGWNDSTVRLVTTNLYVAGELFYSLVPGGIKDTEPGWQIVSVAHPKMSDIFKSAKYVIRGLWPSPLDSAIPDAPIFGVLSILEDMDWLSRLSRSQSANRVSMRGILGSADGLNFASGGDFWEEWDASLRTRMDDPTDVGPVHLRGAQDLVEPAASGKGMKGLSWVVPDFPYDARIEGRMEALIHRLSYGLPVPPEILLGLQAQSKATAFQVEENSYRAHIEPPAKIVAQVATDVLNTFLDGFKVEVVPDPSFLLAKRHTTEDVKEAHDRGTVSDAYLNEVLGIPASALPSEEELERRARLKRNNEETPEERSSRNDKDAPTAGDNDNESLARWQGRVDMALFRAVDRLGAMARTHKALRDSVPSDIDNADVPSHLGVTVLQQAGLDVANLLSDSLAVLTPATVVGDTFLDRLTEHVLQNLDSGGLELTPDLLGLLQELASDAP